MIILFILLLFSSQSFGLNDSISLNRNARSYQIYSPSSSQSSSSSSSSSLPSQSNQQSFFNYVTYSEIKSRINIFPNDKQLDQLKSNKIFDDSNDLTDFKEIEIDELNEFVYIGAKNYLIKLSYGNDSLTLIDPNDDIVDWKPTRDSINDCKRIKPYNLCQNYIRLISIERNEMNSGSNKRILVCGTFAYKPMCTWRNLNRLSYVYETFDGLGKLPQSPESSSTYLNMNENGDYYFATSIDLNEPGFKPDYLIERSLGKSKQLRTDQLNSNWLNEPTFVSSLTIGNYVYFFIRETAIEFMNCGQRIYSRVIRMCKYDSGLSNQEIWKTFEKARLNCSIDRVHNDKSFANIYSPFKNEHTYSFYFDELVDVFHDKSKNLIYTLFSTQSNGIKGSAVCVYDENALETAFRGPFQHQKSKESVWEPTNDNIQTAKCEPSSRSSYSFDDESKYADSQKFQLKYLSVQPLFNRPLFVLPNQRLTKLVVDNIITKHQSNVDMMFLTSERNTLLKYMVLNMDSSIQRSSINNNEQSPTVCLLEEIELFQAINKIPFNSINNLILLKNSKETNRNLLIASQSNLVRMPIANCEAQNNYLGCLSLMDPYCVWDSKAQKCLLIFKTNETLDSSFNNRAVSLNIKANSHLHQNPINTCPTTSVPVDGGFSDWSPWNTCYSKTGERCQCRMRFCNSPEPRNGGKICDESQAIEINDCEVNGGWTEWSSWSGCSLIGSLASNCDPLQSISPKAIRTRTRSCTNPAPKNNGRICVGVDQEEEICTSEMINPCSSYQTVNQWMPWGPWEECSRPCGEGFQMRRRLCNGKNCFGCNQEWRTCNSEPCKDKQDKSSEWDLVEFNKESKQKLEKRIKFTCLYDQNLYDFNQNSALELNSSLEYRLCNEDDKYCKLMKSLKELGEFTEWSEWSACQECGDEQMRTRRCKSNSVCFGHDREMRACPCKQLEDENDGWSCWTDFSECSATSCNSKGIQKRTRKCTKGNCKGQYEEIKSCFRANCTVSDVDIERFPGLTDRHLFVKARNYFQKVTFSFTHLIISCILAFLFGSIAILLIIYAYFKPKSRLERNLFCSCCCRKKNKNTTRKFPTITHHISGNGLCAEQHISSSSSTSSSDHNSEGTETGITDVLNLQTTNESTKLQYCLATSDSSCTSANSNHSKEYFTIANRFDPVGLSSLLNDVIPDDDDEMNTMITSAATTTTTTNLLGFGTLGRNKNKNTSLNLPNKSFNTYTTLNRNSNKLMSSGVPSNETTSSITNNNQQQQTAYNATSSSSSSPSSAATTTTNSLNLNSRILNFNSNTGTLRSQSNNQQRTSFNFPLRTNLDQEL